MIESVNSSVAAVNHVQPANSCDICLVPSTYVFKFGIRGLLLSDRRLFQTDMRLLQSLLAKLGLNKVKAERHPIRVFLLDDDKRRHRWFSARFKGDFLDMADNVAQAREFLSANSYDAIFLDHDLHPEHYNSESRDDTRTGFAIASWLAANPELQPASTILVHTRNADGAMRMVEELRRAGRSAEYVPFPMLEERIKRYWRH